MGFYHLDKPPDNESRWARYVPTWLKNWWRDTSEVLLITRMVFGIILPVMGALLGFIFLFAGLIFLLNLCGSAG